MFQICINILLILIKFPEKLDIIPSIGQKFAVEQELEVIEVVRAKKI